MKEIAVMCCGCIIGIGAFALYTSVLSDTATLPKSSSDALRYFYGIVASHNLQQKQLEISFVEIQEAPPFPSEMYFTYDEQSIFTERTYHAESGTAATSSGVRNIHAAAIQKGDLVYIGRDPARPEALHVASITRIVSMKPNE